MKEPAPELVERYLDEALTAAQRQELSDWCAEKPRLAAFAAELRLCRRIGNLLRPAAGEATWRRVDAALGAHGEDGPTRPVLAWARRLRPAVLTALAACLLLGIGTAWFLAHGSAGRIVETGRADTRNVELAAIGVRLRVDEQSRVRIPAGPGAIRLDRGRLSAEVRPRSPQTPFAVLTPNAEALAIGTQFTCVFAHEATSLLVDEGLVAFTDRETGACRRIAAGYAATLAPPPPMQPMRDGWRSVTVGVAGATGAAAWRGDRLRIVGTGPDLWEGIDGCHLVGKPAPGDWVLTCRVLDLGEGGPVDRFAKVGLTVRASLASESEHITICYSYHCTYDTSHATLIVRDQAGGPTRIVGQGFPLEFPGWLRLRRQGDAVTAAASADGRAWTTWETVPAPPGQQPWVGCVVTSHQTDTTVPALFDQVAFTSMMPPQPAD